MLISNYNQVITIRLLYFLLGRRKTNKHYHIGNMRIQK